MMIKGVTIMRPAASSAAYDKLESFFSTLGFESGQGWKDERSRGVSFLAPVGNLEFLESPGFNSRVKAQSKDKEPGAAEPESFARSLERSFEIWVEVTGLDDIEAVARKWMAAAGTDDETRRRLTAIADTDWKARAFTMEPVAGYAFTFWEWQDPLHNPAKDKPLVREGNLSADGMRFAVVVARWNAVITDRLLQGALDALLRSGAARADLQVIRVPGAWEIPAAARTAAMSGQVDAVIALGVLLRGETAHYEAIYNEVSRGLGQSQQETGLPHAFGVLTCETLEQALNRAGLKAGNKGFEAAIAAIEMVSLQRKMREPGNHPAAPAQTSVHRE